MIDWLLRLTLTRRKIGPFPTETLQALSNNECVRCGGKIGDYSLLANSLVVLPGTIDTVCRRCRGGGEVPENVYQSFGQLQTFSILWLIRRHRCSRTGKKLRWLEVVNCLRTGYVHFQNAVGRPADAFAFKDSTSTYYGNLLSIGNCGDCGAFWTSDEYGMVPLSSYGSGKKWNKKECWHCGLPHSLQWNMRITKEQEEQMLYGWPATHNLLPQGTH
jgi:hypothetical protein